MIKVSILYPAGEDITFDMDYYCNTHMPMLAKLVSNCKKIEIDQGLMGGAPGTPPPYIAMGHAFFENMEEFAVMFPQHRAVLTADIPNFTNAIPVLQFSEVKM